MPVGTTIIPALQMMKLRILGELLKITNEWVGRVRLKSRRTCWCSPWRETLGSDFKLCCWRASDLGHIPYMAAGIHGKALITYMSIYCIVRSSQIILWEIILYFSPKAWNILKGMKPLSWEGIWQLLCREQPLKVCSLFLHEKVIWHPQLRSLNTFAQIVPSIKTFLSINFQHTHALYTRITILKSHMT